MNLSSSYTQARRGSFIDNSSSTRNLANIAVEAAESSRRISRAASDVAQLRLSKTSLHGRDDEIKLLRRKLRDLEASLSDIILVAGKSGTGKSALINKGIGEAATRYGYAFTKGKFDQKLRRPLSAFSDAMTSLCRYIRKSNCAALIQEEILNEFDEERREQLRRVLPGCAGLFGASIDKRRKSASAILSLAQIERDDVSCCSFGSAKNLNLVGGETVPRTQYAIRRLLKIICSHLKGVILFIDDLQWGDKATLDILSSIVLDKDIPSVLIVGAYREDQVDDHLASFIQNLQEMDVSRIHIHVGNLSTNDVTSFVAEALRMDEDNPKVETLANIIHKKTEGNPFFVSIFLTSLFDDTILQYNFGAMRWIWDDDEVKARAVTDNVASVLVNKINRLNEDTQLILMVASCLGAHFHLPVLVKIMKNLSDDKSRSSLFLGSYSESDARSQFALNDVRSSSIEHLIQEAEVEGLLETDDNENCYFVHDQIQSAAFDLIPSDNRDEFRAKIGSVMYRTLASEEVECNLLEIVGLLNCALSSFTNKDRNQLAELNLKAGAKASENGAFDTAKVYYEAGRKALGSNGWERNFSTMLDICSDGANACYLTGDFETMNVMIEEVLSKYTDATDKYRATEVKVKALYAQGMVNESIDVALDFRRQLGLPTLKRKRVSMIATLRQYSRVMRLLKNMTVDDILDLPELEDEHYDMGQRMNELLGPSLYHVEPTMAPLVVFDMVTTTLKHGLNPTSCFALATLGLILCGHFDKLDQGREMARAAELMLKLPGMRRITSNTIFIVQCFCYHWTSPLQDTIAPLLKGCEEGLAIGDTESACYCLLTRCFNLYFIGRSLDSVYEEVEASIDIMTQLKQVGQCSEAEILEITVKKLRRVATNDDDQKMDAFMKAALAKGDATLAATAFSFKLEMSVLMQEWGEALETLHQAIDAREATRSLFLSIRFTFLEALTYLKTAQSSSGLKRMKMKRSGKKSMKLLQGWAKRGNVNVVHYLHVLEAEVAFLEGKIKKAEEGFKSAISSSRRNGFLHDTALVHELSSLFHAVQGDAYWSNYHIECAMMCYKEWGCSMKIDRLNAAKLTEP